MQKKAAKKRHSDEDEQESNDNKDSGLHTSRSSTRKRKHLKRFNVTEIIVDKKVKLLVELQALAH